MTVQILAVGKLAKGYLKEGVEDYSRRIRRHCRLELTEIPEQDGKCAAPQLREGELLLEKLARQKTFCIALSPGDQPQREPLYSSEKLASKLQALQNQGHSHFSFVIGGSDGLSPQLLQCADMCLSFSALTFPHQLFRLMLCEQIYRCLKINNGQTYHK